jgi:hypothetical protein
MAKRKSTKVEDTNEAELVEDVGEEDEVKELIEVSGASFDMWEGVDSTFVPTLREGMDLVERKETIRSTLHKAVKIDEQINLITGELLYEVRENKYYKEWTFEDEETKETKNYNKFDDYCLEELGLNRRKAFYLVDIYSKFVVDLGLSREQLRELEWTKAAIIVKQITAESAEEWLGRMKTMSKRQLQEYVKGLKGEGGDTEYKRKTFKINADKYETVEQALEVMGKMQPSDSEGDHLHAICAEFMSGATAVGKEGAWNKLQVAIRNIEAGFGVEIEVKGVEESKWSHYDKEEESAEEPVEAEA